jgi:flagellar biosynthesis/type III secretory pathway ATPase
LYTVYVEGDDLSDPVADAARSLLDGHIVLSRELADRGHFPAIDVLGSVSRLMPQVVAPEHMRSALALRARLAAYKAAEDLVMLGAYAAGSDPEVDAALRSRELVRAFLTQPKQDGSPLEATRALLAGALAAGTAGVEA